MPVSSRFVQCPYGQWTSLCIYNELRKSLYVGAFVTVGTIAMNTGGVLQDITGTSATGAAGILPAGLPLGTLYVGGPAIFRMQYHLDGEATWQQWYYYPVGPSGDAGTAWVNGNTSTPPLTITLNLTQAAGDYVLVVYSAVDDAHEPVVTSATTGTIPSFFHSTISTATPNYLHVNAYTFPVNGTDTITITSDGNGVLSYAYTTSTSGPYDTSGLTAGGTSPVLVQVNVPLAYSPETLVQITYGEGAATGWAWNGAINSVQNFSDTQSSPDATQWSIGLAVGLSNRTVTPEDVQVSWVGTLTQNSAWLFAFVPGGATLGTSVNVIEVFDFPPVDQNAGRTITARLPQLSAAGVAALKALMSTGTSEVQTNALSDTADDV